jgi:putative salt-induced outer membrane protein YdiY
MKILAVSRSVLLRSAAVAALILMVVRPSFGKRKDDVVIMTNGDRFTGEIKGVQYGELIFKSDYMEDSVHLDWKRVAVVESKDTYIVALSDGRRITGLIKRARVEEGNKQEFTVSSSDSALEVSPQDVTTIDQREASFWNQLTGSVDYGFGFASDNHSTNSSLGAEVAFHTTNNSIALTTSSQFDSQANAKNTNRFTFDSQYGRNITTNWLAIGLFTVLKSNQQDLALRTTFGGGFARKLIQTDRTTLLAIGGAAYSHESYFPQPGTQPVVNNAEVLAGLKFSTFRFKTLNINSQTLLFPSLSEAGRFRVSSQSNLRIELVRNFYWNFQVYENYDTHPPVTAPKNDLGLTTSIGWTF